ncbi:hypothetical protein Sango_0729100 [Sesamum angolense]|uniref:DUF7733 domain-containing protein n=2 Tax=Sesamum TaxID=4181 RepID=A0AAE1X1N6_9LAMI|nr:hypothetical protein Sango_0729100 [Sesamum angolense]
MEGLTFSSRFSLPVRVLVPVFYNAMRILSVMEWVRNEFSKVESGYGIGIGGSGRRGSVGKALAAVNMGFWSFNLFGFLLPFYLPKAFKLYYSNSKFRD